MQIKTNLVGEHKGTKFALVDGLLNIYGTVISEQGVKHLVEIVTLLKAQGYELRRKFPRMKPMSMQDMIRGKKPEFYDDDETEIES